MKIIYLVDFPVNGNYGKNKATREKAKALKEIVGKDNFMFLYPNYSKNIFQKYFNKLFLDFKVSFKFLLLNNHFTVIQRVSFLPFTRLILYCKRIKVITEFHADFKDEIPFLGKSVVQRLILYLLSPFFNYNYKISHGIIYNHPFLKEKFDKVYKVPSISSYNGANFKEFFPTSKKTARKSLDIETDKIIFLFLGSVSKWHGVDLLIDIFNDEDILAQKNFFLYIVGGKESEYLLQLKNKVKNKNIIFKKPVSLEIAKSYINASDFCMLPVKQVRISPGSPLKLYDYIACGKPVIAQSNLPAYSDEIEKYNLGYVTDFNNIKESAKKLIAITQSDKKFNINNRKVAVEILNWEQRMQKWIQFAKKINN